MALIGYARVSTQDQSTNLQMAALRDAGCIKVFTDQMSGGTTQRPGLDAAIAFMREGDCLCTWKLDRLGRSLTHVVSTINDLASHGIGFRSITENIETQSSSGKLVMHIFAALAEFERSLIKERVTAGLAAAKRRGRVGGRPKVIDPSKAAAIAAMRTQSMSMEEICATLSISRSTLYRHSVGKAP